MYRVDRNNFYTEQKKATIYTPQFVAEFIFDLVSKKIKKGLVFDPCVGTGALLKPFQKAGYEVLGVDIESQGFKPIKVINFLELKKGEIKTPSLVVVNPPFNIDKKTKAFIKKNYPGRPLLPEIWLMKIIELFGADIPIVLFAPYGLRLNQTTSSKRWSKFIDGVYPEISSIISLPKDCFRGVLFHSEILIFNIKKLKAHYFYDDKKKETLFKHESA
ncbi:MAG: N-6 DNA methylase [Bdellovibrionales bacterium]|nr:N-6 DNA methylase [Bdellovibrionales bacterium]